MAWPSLHHSAICTQEGDSMIVLAWVQRALEVASCLAFALVFSPFDVKCLRTHQHEQGSSLALSVEQNWSETIKFAVDYYP